MWKDNNAFQAGMVTLGVLAATTFWPLATAYYVNSYLFGKYSETEDTLVASMYFAMGVAVYMAALLIFIYVWLPFLGFNIWI